MPLRSPLPDLDIPNQSLSDLLLKRIDQYGNDVALIDSSLGGKSVTFAEVYCQIRSLAGFLHKEGLKKGEVVALSTPLCIEYPIAMFGAIATGAVVTICNPSAKKAETLREFGITQPKIVIVHESALGVMKEAVEELSCVEKLFVIGKSSEFTTFDSLIKSEHEKDFPREITFNTSEDLAFLPFSSGTTGMPKGVMLTHKSMVAMSLIQGRVTGCDRSDCFYINRPTFHVSGFCFTTFALFHGMKLVMEKEFNIYTMLADFARYKITRTIAMPFALMEMANAENLDSYDTSSLKEMQCGGDALSPSIMSALMGRTTAKMLPIYGMTEFFPISINNDTDRFLSSVGSVVPNTQVKIIDIRTGEEVGANTKGEILVTGPQVMKGYFKNLGETEKTVDTEGWVHTGDIGYFNDHGMLYVIDRLKHVMIHKAALVSPAELESVILKHPKVADVGVIGIPDPVDGDLPKAFVVKKEESLTSEEVLELVKDELAEYKQLRGGVEFITTVPRSQTGKIQRAELKKMTTTK